MLLFGQVWAYEQIFVLFLDLFLERIVGQVNVYYLNYVFLGDEYIYYDGFYYLDKKSVICFLEKLVVDFKVLGVLC